jgi:hypothetical protein
MTLPPGCGEGHRLPLHVSRQHRPGADPGKAVQVDPVKTRVETASGFSA